MSLEQVVSGVGSPEIIVNANFVALEPGALFGIHSAATAALTLGLYGGNLMVGTTPTLLANTTTALTASQTNYVESTTAGSVSANTSAFTAGRIQIGIAVTGASTITSWTDKRTSGVGGAGSGGGGGFTSPTGTGFAHITSGALDGAAVTPDLSGAHVTGTLAAARMPALTGDVTTSAGAVATTIKNSVSLVTPVLNVATATSINKVAITAPATSATLTVADGKTLTASNSITLAGTDGKTLTVSKSLTLDGTDSTTMTFPPASASIGYLNIPQNSQSTAYTTVLADAGKHLLHPAADTTARTFTIDSNANVAYPIGTAITIINQNAGGVITIAITSDTMRLAGAGTTGSRTLAANGVATAIKITSTEWIVSGTGLT